MGFRFRDFPIYQELRHFISEVYLLSKRLPRCEQFELVSQLRRAGTSSLLNLAEGSMKNSGAELNRYLLISIGSLSEIVAILDICLDRKYISSSIHKRYLLQCESLVKKLYSFRRNIRISR